MIRTELVGQHWTELVESTNSVGVRQSILDCLWSLAGQSRTDLAEWPLDSVLLAESANRFPDWHGGVHQLIQDG